MLKKRRTAAILLSLFLVVSLLAGCGATQSSGEKNKETVVSTQENSVAETAQQPKPVTISVGDAPKEDEKGKQEAYAKYLQTMKEKYPYITVVLDQYTYDVNSFLPKAESGQLPNLYTTFFTEPVKIINGGYAADITVAVKKYGYDKVINPKFLKLVEKDGKYYGIPIEGYTMGMYYNIKLMKQAGLVDNKGIPTFPKTYDELAQMAKTIKAKTGKAGFFYPAKNNQGGWQFMNIAWSYGAEFEKLVDGKWKAVFNSPQAVAALQYLKDMKWKDNTLQDNVLSDVGDLFRLSGSDQVAMAFGGWGFANASIGDYKASKDNFAGSAAPAGPAGQVVLMGGALNMFSPNSTPEQIDAGLKWLAVTGKSPNVTPEVLSGIEASLKADKEAGKITGPHDLYVWVNPERVNAETTLRQKYASVDMALWNDFVENGAKNIHPEEPFNVQELYKTLDGVIQAVLTDKNADPKALLDKAAADFQAQYLDKLK